MVTEEVLDETPPKVQTPVESAQADQKAKDNKRGMVKDVVASAAAGVPRGIGDIFDSINLVADLAERFTGIEQIVKQYTPENNIPYLKNLPTQGLFANKSEVGKKVDQLSDTVFGESQTTVGGFAGGITRFGTGMLAAGGIGRFKTLGRGMSEIHSVAGNIISNQSKINSFGRVALEGAELGAVSDFLITDEEDSLFVDFMSNLASPAKDAIHDFVEGDLSNEELLLKKLKSIPEGILFGGALNLGFDQFTRNVLPDLVKFATRLKAGRVSDVSLNPREEAIKAGLKEGTPKYDKFVDNFEKAKAKDAPKAEPEFADPLEGKTYQNEKIVRIINEDGSIQYAKESRISKKRKSPTKQGDDYLVEEDLKNLFSEEERYALQTYEDNYLKKQKTKNEVQADIKTTEQALKEMDEGRLPNKAQLNASGRIYRLTQMDDKQLAAEYGDQFKVSDKYKTDNVYSVKDAQSMQRVHDVAPEAVENLIKNKGVSAYDVRLQEKRMDAAKLELEDTERAFLANPDDPIAVQEYLRADEAYKMVREAFMESGSELGRGLRHFGLIKKDKMKKEYMKNVKDYLNGVDTDALLKEMTVKHNVLKNVGLDPNAKKFASMSTSKKSIEALYSVYVANLLSGVSTNVINVMSGAVTTFMKTSSRAMLAFGGQSEASRRGAQAYLQRMLSVGNFVDSAAVAIRTFTKASLPKHLRVGADVTKVDIDFRFFNEMAKAQQGKDTMLSALVAMGSKGADAVVSTPSRLLVGADAFFKQAQFNSNVSEGVAIELALKGAPEKQISEGLNAVRNLELDSPALKDVNLESHMDRLARETSEVTFTMEPNNIMNKVQDGINKVDIGGFKPLKWLFPFSRISMNMVRFTIHNSPFLNRLSPTVGEIMRKGGVDAERKQAEIYVTGVMMTAGAALYSGGMITGREPRNPQERNQLTKAGWKANAIKTFDGYLDLKRLGPIGNILAFTSHVGTILESLDDTEADYGDKAAEIMVGAATILNDTFTPTFLSENMFNVMDVFTDPSKSSDDVLSYVGNVSANLIPGSGFLTRNKQFFGENAIKEFDADENKILAGFKRNYPWLDTTLKPQVDVFGDDRQVGIMTGDQNMDLLGELERLSESAFIDTDEFGVEKSALFQPMSRTLSKEVLGEQAKVYKLNNDQWYRLQKATAGTLEGEDYAPPYGMSFKEKWREEYKAGYPEAKGIYGDSDEAVVTYLRGVHKEYKDAAKEFIMSDMDVLEGYLEGIDKATERRSQKLEGVNFRR